MDFTSGNFLIVHTAIFLISNIYLSFVFGRLYRLYSMFWAPSISFRKVIWHIFLDIFYVLYSEAAVRTDYWVIFWNYLSDIAIFLIHWICLTQEFLVLSAFLMICLFCWLFFCILLLSTDRYCFIGMEAIEMRSLNRKKGKSIMRVVKFYSLLSSFVKFRRLKIWICSFS